MGMVEKRKGGSRSGGEDGGGALNIDNCYNIQSGEKKGKG